MAAHYWHESVEQGAGGGRTAPAGQDSTVSKAGIWTGRVISALTVSFLIFDGIAKVLKVAPVLEASARLGLPVNVTFAVGILLLICTAVYVIPRTSVLGAVVWAGLVLRNQRLRAFIIG